ncbi:porin family protein [Marinoscillum furvescens]|uniref:Outer membrane protein with beta-barrel domain n=1 Tax=Marinoscillum furvescens DSM 4134 TaxID=1122208 RepID=A0A3D9L4V1_MARFU|nr:porin family protein [Marinoscillum furvescens]RED98957.1 outer membrane protein with beta-barrel domain [Marinoscillum furvescens DSM 4134]
MRKILFLLALILVSFTSQAQSKLGLKFSPAISSNRISLVDSLNDVEPTGSSFKFSLGLIYDHELTETYFLSTGLIFVPKQVAFEVTEESDQPSAQSPDEPVQEYRLNYLQVPVSLKLFTNEVQPDTRIFFQVGLAPEIKVFSEPMEEEYDMVEEFKSVDATILFGGGVEYRAGINTTLFASITYQRGLGNVIKKESWGFQEELYIRSTLVSLDLGIKF